MNLLKPCIAVVTPHHILAEDLESMAVQATSIPVTLGDRFGLIASEM